jgi:hypothetical protein
MKSWPTDAYKIYILYLINFHINNKIFFNTWTLFEFNKKISKCRFHVQKRGGGMNDCIQIFFFYN